MKIVVALDGSEKDASVLARAGDLARAAGGELLLVHALNPWVDPPDATAPFFDDRIDEVRSCWEQYLQRLAMGLAGLRTAARVEDRRKPAGQRCEDTPECIARVAREWEADLLAVASKRSSGIAGLLLGSTAQALLRLSPCPVLVVRPSETPEEQGRSLGAPAATENVPSAAA